MRRRTIHSRPIVASDTHAALALQVAKDGQRAADYSEATATRAVAGDEVFIRVDVGVGKGKATVWTCDLTDGYVKINGAYRS